MTSHRDIAREVKMRGMYENGATLQGIGDAFGITRERVRQILKRAGASASNGGVSVKKATKVKEAQRRRKEWLDNRSMKNYGCLYADVISLNDGMRLGSKGTLAYAYRGQRRNAAQRKIEWNMSFPEWLEVWVSSGFLEQRGKGTGRYVMARLGDSGPYSKENVYIASGSKNIRDGYCFRKENGYSPRKNRGISKRNKTGVKGVSWDANARKWRACIRVNCKQINLGLHELFDDAVTARKNAEKIYDG